MQKLYFILLISIPFFVSCESEGDKMSRMTLDKYARKLNSVSLDIVSSREEEGSQSLMTLNRFFDRYTGKLEDFNNDLDFENISDRYVSDRQLLLSISRNYYKYLNNRKSTIRNLSRAMSAYERVNDYDQDISEYIDKIRTSRYSSSFYREMALKSGERKYEKTVEFLNSKYSYLEGTVKMDSLTTVIDSIAINYNLNVKNSKLQDSLIVPLKLKDTLDDWLLTQKAFIKTLEIPEREY